MQSAKLFCTAPIFCNHLSPKIKRVGWQIAKVTSVRISRDRRLVSTSSVDIYSVDTVDIYSVDTVDIYRDRRHVSTSAQLFTHLGKMTCYRLGRQ